MAGARGYQKGNDRFADLSEGDLISLHSPRLACPTGVLIDLSDAVHLPYPKELLRVGEFDDTFGIYCDHSAAQAQSLQHQPTKLFTINESRETVNQRLSSQRSPPRTSGADPSQKTPLGLSDSDSLLDLDNLSTFSFSDSEELLEELRKNDESWATSPLTMAKEIEDILRAERRPSAVLEDPKSRDSFSSKLQRLSLLLNSPIPSPPTQTLPAPLDTEKPTDPVTIRPSTPPNTMKLATPRVSTSTMTSPMPDGKASAMKITSAVPTSASKPRRIPYFSYTPTSSLKKPMLGVHESHDVSPPESTNTTSSAFKRLSFSSSSSTSSPTKSIKNESILGTRKGNIGSRVSMTSRPAVSIKAAAQRIGARRSIQPLKATVPLPIPSNVSITSSNDLGMIRTNKSGCASAPVTRKFIPPVTASSPQPHPPASSFNTPSRAGRKSFTVVRSSGYGQQSPNTSITSAHKISAPSPTNRKYIPTPIAKTLPSPKPCVRQVMGAKGQLPQNDINSVPQKTTKMETSSGIRRSSYVSKENKFKINSFLPRPAHQNN